MLEARRITCKRCRELGSGSPIDRAVEKTARVGCFISLFGEVVQHLGYLGRSF